MVKATFTLQNGTTVAIEGETSEVRALLDYYSTSKTTTSSPPISINKKTSRFEPTQNQASTNQVNHLEIINMVKNT